ncbi:MAG: hypothetical protein MUP09_07275 [Thiovulaceae bacterium]|nr:hypothetical protein [Sulfurimonadaceae bacterium]
MLWRSAALLSLPLLLSALEQTFSVENTNFTIDQATAFAGLSAEKSYLYNYDRLRLHETVTSEGLYATVIADLVNYYGESYVDSDDFGYVELLKPDIPFKTRTSFHGYGSGSVYAKLHRLYGGYEDDRQRVTVGVQKITMGVGRIWTPTDLFNPKNSFALEPDELFGALAAVYAYSPSQLSTLRGVVSMKEDRSYKYAASYKAFLEVADFGLNAIESDQTTMLGYEAEGNFFDTGAEWRSEGGYFKNRTRCRPTIAPCTQEELSREFFQAIAGFDYGFENGITWTVEGYYSSETFSYEQIIRYYNSEILGNMVQSNVYIGSSLMYDFNLFLGGSLLYIESFNSQNSRFVAPTLTYTLNDHNSFSLGAMLNSGSAQSEFGPFGNTFFFKWQLSF